MNKAYDIVLNDRLFGLDCCSDYEDSEYEERVELAEQVIKDCGQDAVFEAWFNYLKESVKTKEEARSFMLWFFNYNGTSFKLKDPYSFLGLLFAKQGFSFDDENLENDQFFGTFDSIYISLLVNAGIVKEIDYFNANPFKDKKLIAAINSYKNK